jgi:hypothetical protein
MQAWLDSEWKACESTKLNPLDGNCWKQADGTRYIRHGDRLWERKKSAAK